MTKRDYELVAEVLSKFHPLGRSAATNHFVVAFLADNPRFNPDKFMLRVEKLAERAQ